MTRFLIRLAAIASLAVGFSRLAQAADGTPPAMTLDQAIAYGLSHNPTLASYRAQVAQGQEAARVPRNRWLPTIGATAQIYEATDNNTAAVVAPSDSLILPRLGGRGFDAAATFDNGQSYRPYASTILGVGITQQVFDFGLTAARIASADATLLAERHDLDRSTLDTRLSVSVSFLAVQVAHEVKAAAEAAVTRATAQRDQAAALVQGQLRSRIFLERAQAELSRLRVSLLRAQSGVTIAQSGLSIAVGLDQPLLDAQGTMALPHAFPPLDQAMRDASTNDPTLKVIEARIEAQRQTASAIGALARPTILLSGAVSARSGGAPTGGPDPQFSGYVPETPNWDIGLIANWSFFDPVVFAEARAARAQEEVLRGQLAAARQQLTGAVQDAWETTSEAISELPDLEKALEAAKQNYDQANVRFQQGLGTSVEIADAETLLTDSEVQLAEGQFGLARANARLERTMAGGL